MSLWRGHAPHTVNGTVSTECSILGLLNATIKNKSLQNRCWICFSCVGIYKFLQDAIALGRTLISQKRLMINVSKQLMPRGRLSHNAPMAYKIQVDQACISKRRHILCQAAKVSRLWPGHVLGTMSTCLLPDPN